MFGIGTMELLVILLVGVMVLGPEHLPKLVRTLAKVMSEVRRVSTDFQRTINLEANKEEWQQTQKQTTAAPKKKKKKKAAPAPDLAQQPEAPAAPAPVNAPEEIPAVYAAADTAAPAPKAEEASAPDIVDTADAAEDAHGDKA